MIDAANLYQTIKVTPIQTVPVIQRMKRDNSGNGQHEAKTSEPVSFAGELKKAMENNNNKSNDCYTVTYNSSMKLQSFFYTEQRDYSKTL